MRNRLSAVTFSQIKIFNETRKTKVLCKVFGHKLKPVADTMPIRVKGSMRQHEVETCARCGFVKVIGRA